MATKEQIHDLIAKAMADEQFKAALMEDPRKAAGFDLTDEQVAALKEADFPRAEGLDERLSKKKPRFF